MSPADATALVLAGLAVTGALAGCEQPRTAALRFEHVPMPGATTLPGGAPLPFSAAVRSGPLLFLSGQLGTDSTLRLVPGGIGPETRQAMRNISAIVTAAGGSMERIAKCTVMMADMAEWGAMNEEYLKFFPGPRPARSALGASGLALGARVEIECIAVLEDR